LVVPALYVLWFRVRENEPAIVVAPHDDEAEYAPELRLRHAAE
jgi:hypothetical protein